MVLASVDHEVEVRALGPVEQPLEQLHATVDLAVVERSAGTISGAKPGMVAARKP